MKQLIKKYYYYFLSLSYFAHKQRRIEKMHSKDRVQEVMLMNAGRQLTAPQWGKLHYDDSNFSIIGKYYRYGNDFLFRINFN
jgi:hypothetical protein